MFRRLFALESTAFRDQLEDLRHRVADAEGHIAETARDLLAIGRDTASHGVWNLRRPV